MKVYNMFGNHTAKTGGVFPLTAKVEETVWNRI